MIDESLPEFTVSRYATIQMFTKVRAASAEAAEAIADTRYPDHLVDGDGDLINRDDETDWVMWHERPVLGEALHTVRSAEPARVESADDE